MAEENWATAITDIGSGKIRVRGYGIVDIIAKLSDGGTV